MFIKNLFLIASLVVMFSSSSFGSNLKPIEVLKSNGIYHYGCSVSSVYTGSDANVSKTNLGWMFFLAPSKKSAFEKFTNVLTKDFGLFLGKNEDLYLNETVSADGKKAEYKIESIECSLTK